MGKEILQLISGRESLLIPAVDGRRLIHSAKDVFSEIDLNFIGRGLTKYGIATAEQRVEVYKLGKDATLMEMFAYLSKRWVLKYLSQNQVIEFFEQLSSWLPEFRLAEVFFLCKKDENSYINEADLMENLVIVGVCCWDGKLSVNLYQLNEPKIWLERHNHQVVIPKY